MSRFSTTVWPGAQVPIPPVTRYVVVQRDEAIIEYVAATSEAPLPPEVLLRELPRLDENNDHSLVFFMNQHGALTSYADNGQALLPRSERLWLTPGTAPGEAPIEVVRRHVQVLRALVKHWNAHQHQNNRGVRMAWADIDLHSPVKTITEAWGQFSDHLNAALAPFSVRINISGAAAAEHEYVTAYSAMALSLANDITRGALWRRCANEPCGTLFSHQIGRAEHGQNRSTGVKYCSRSCARAQGERERRRRPREEKGAS
jgi:hypothetical protein